MDERALEIVDGACASRMTLRIDGRRYPILRQGPDTCLIRAPQGTRLRGYADIFDGENHRAHCLVLLSAPEGDLIRLTYKWRSPVLPGPPCDFVRD